MVYFKTAVPADTLAWRIWLNGAGNQIYDRQTLAPTEQTPGLIQTGEILTQPGQMLVVPPFLTNAVFNTYFIGVSGDVGTVIHLDSRKHAVTDIPFGSLTNMVISAGNFPYRTFRVQVPVQQIAWQLNLLPASGAPNIAVRRDVVPNEFRNDAFSEPPA